MELEIASVRPFLATLPEEDQHAVRKTIGERAFGAGVEPLNVEDAGASTSGLVEIINMAMRELFKRVQ